MTGAANHPDAELLAAYERWLEARRAHVVADDQDDDDDEARERYCRAIDDVEEKIEALFGIRGAERQE